jgi:two-component system, sensor histidine kinase and response regulator
MSLNCMTKIMVVDDEDILVEMVAELIEDLGHESVVASNGQEALASLVDEPEMPALIISDVMMPRMNGVEFARMLKTDPRFKHVPIVLMSAAGRSFGDDSADYFIHKPFDMDLLADLIQYFATRNSAERVGRAAGR